MVSDCSDSSIVMDYHFLFLKIGSLFNQIMKVYSINKILFNYMQMKFNILEFFHSFFDVSIEKN